LNSTTAGPEDVSASPAYNSPENGVPRRSSSAATGATTLIVPPLLRQTDYNESLSSAMSAMVALRLHHRSFKLLAGGPCEFVHKRLTSRLS
jgi:hypothetical protein